MNTDRSVFKILVLSEFNDGNANVIRDFLFCFNKYSRHDYYYHFNPRLIDTSFDFSAFDVILLFWSIYYPGAALSSQVREKIAKSSAVKVLFLQDEYRHVRLYNKIMNELGVELMFTCVAEKDHKIFYPPELIPSLRATYSVLTGYVPSYLESYQPEPNLQRSIDIGYRSRSLPYYLGDLGHEKTVIAQKFQEFALEYGFRADISVREEDRIYGDTWVKFLKSSRFVLGSPSGASVIDFTGEIARNCERYLALYPDASYEDVKQRFFADVDGKTVIDTVSPRIFESTALGCIMVMHEGYYGGILEQNRHYVSIKKDYSNIQEVVAQMRDEKYCLQIARNAYQDLIASKKYSYKGFVKWFDGILDMHVHPSARTSAPSKFSYYARNYLIDGQVLVPHSDGVYSLPFGGLIQKYHLVKITLHHTSICFQHPGIRRLFGKYILNKYLEKLGGSHPEPKPVMMDLARMSILSQIVLGGKGKITGNFRVRLDANTDKGILRFVSYLPRDDKRQLPAENLPARKPGAYFDVDSIVSAVSQGKLLIEWDHSPVATNLEFIFHSAHHTLDMGLDGHYKFQGIGLLSQHFPRMVASVIRPILNTIEHG